MRTTADTDGEGLLGSQNLPSPLLLLLIGLGALQDFGGEQAVALEGGFPAPVAVSAKVPVGVALEAFRDRSQQKSQGDANTWFSGFKVNYLQDLVDACLGGVLQAAAEQVGGAVVVHIRNVPPEGFDDRGQAGRRFLARVSN